MSIEKNIERIADYLELLASSKDLTPLIECPAVALATQPAVALAIQPAVALAIQPAVATHESVTAKAIVKCGNIGDTLLLKSTEICKTQFGVDAISDLTADQLPAFSAAIDLLQ